MSSRQGRSLRSSRLNAQHQQQEDQPDIDLNYPEEVEEDQEQDEQPDSDHELKNDSELRDVNENNRQDNSVPPFPASSSSSNSMSIGSNARPVHVDRSSSNRGVLGHSITHSALANVPTLDGTDAAAFADWRVKLKGYCLMQGISDIVYKPYEETLELALIMDNHSRPRVLIAELVKSLHARAFGAIMLAVQKMTGSALFSEIEAEQAVADSSVFIDTNANYLWNKLVALYDKKTIFSSLHVWKRLISLNYKDGENPQIMRKQFDSLLIQLGQIKDVTLPGQPISEGLKACIWLNALPASMETTSQAFLTQPKVALDDIYQTLVRRFEASGSSKRPRIGTEVANTAVVHPSSNNKSSHTNQANRSLNLTCHFCKKKGHIERECWSKHADLRPKHNSNNFNSKHRTTNNQQKRPAPHPVGLCLVETVNDSVPKPRAPSVHSVVSSAPIDQSAHAYALSHDAGTYITNRHEFILDSGASKHIVYDQSLLHNQKDIAPVKLTGILKQSVHINQVGSVQLSDNVILNDVACVGEAGANLISVSKILDAGCKLQWSRSKVNIFHGRQLLITFIRSRGVYIFKRPQSNSVSSSIGKRAAPSPTAMTAQISELKPNKQIKLSKQMHAHIDHGQTSHSRDE
jgi:hypothetical protein